jgi:putative acetyltransferase
MTVTIRAEAATDRDAVAALLDSAFGGNDETQLVDRLRADGDVLAAFVAEVDGKVVGHILFSPLPVGTSAGVLPAAALAPLAVQPDRHRQGIGAALVGHGLAACRAAGVPLVVVWGDPEYYPRFGFSAAQAAGLRAPIGGPAFMAVMLDPALPVPVTGKVRYPRAFDLEGAG